MRGQGSNINVLYNKTLKRKPDEKLQYVHFNKDHDLSSLTLKNKEEYFEALPYFADHLKITQEKEDKYFEINNLTDLTYALDKLYDLNARFSSHGVFFRDKVIPQLFKDIRKEYLNTAGVSLEVGLKYINTDKQKEHKKNFIQVLSQLTEVYNHDLVVFKTKKKEGKYNN